jgi:hypothetical protein
MLAGDIEQVQPLIDIRGEDSVARHPVAEFRMVERRVGMHGAEHVGMQLCLQPGLDRIGDHQIGFAFRQGVEDGRIIGPDDDRRRSQMRPGEPLVGAARIEDDAHARLVDLRQGLVFRTSPQRVIGVLPLDRTGLENSPIFWRSRVMVIPPIAMSNLPALRSASSVGQPVFTISSLTPSDLARLFAMSTSMPSTAPEAAAMEKGR